MKTEKNDTLSAQEQVRQAAIAQSIEDILHHVDMALVTVHALQRDLHYPVNNLRQALEQADACALRETSTVPGGYDTAVGGRLSVALIALRKPRVSKEQHRG